MTLEQVIRTDMIPCGIDGTLAEDSRKAWKVAAIR